jgi:hypothetical protein
MIRVRGGLLATTEASVGANKQNAHYVVQTHATASAEVTFLQ